MLAYSLGAETVSPRAGNALTTLQTLPAERHPSSAEEVPRPERRDTDGQRNPLTNALSSDYFLSCLDSPAVGFGSTLVAVIR
jgi:hypothetical protein